MKLIEVLVKKQREEGWKWPECAMSIAQDGNGSVYGYACKSLNLSKINMWRSKSGNDLCPGVLFECKSEDWDTSFITREEYEAALAASKEMLVNKPVAWDGQGLPPVGAECELYDCEKWIEVRIKYTGDNVVVVHEFGSAHSERVFHLAKKPENFRPIRTEAERNRDVFCRQLVRYLDRECDANNPFCENDVAAFYDAIAAGKIPGVKLEAPDA